MSRAYTKEESKKMFLDAVKCYINYWEHQDISSKEKLEGLAFGVMNIIDGSSSAMPCSIDLVLRPHPDDKQYHIDESENYIEDGLCINDDTCLHEEILK